MVDYTDGAAGGALRSGDIGNRTNPEEARRLGQAAAEGFALSVAPIIARIVDSGIATDAGIAEALNARGIPSLRQSTRAVSLLTVGPQMCINPAIGSVWSNLSERRDERPRL